MAAANEVSSRRQLLLRGSQSPLKTAPNCQTWNYNNDTAQGRGCCSRFLPLCVTHVLSQTFSFHFFTRHVFCNATSQASDRTRAQMCSYECVIQLFFSHTRLLWARRCQCIPCGGGGYGRCACSRSRRACCSCYSFQTPCRI